MAYIILILIVIFLVVMIFPFFTNKDSSNDVKKYGLTENEISNLFTQEELDNLDCTIDDVKDVISWNVEVEEIIKNENSTKDEIVKIISKKLRRRKYEKLWIEKYCTLEPIYKKSKGIYYVYQYKIHDQVMYIGKGTKTSTAVPYNRAADIWGHKYCRAYIDMIEVEILKNFEDEADALSYEIELIKHYNLKNLLNRKH